MDGQPPAPPPPPQEPNRPRSLGVLLEAAVVIALVVIAIVVLSGLGMIPLLRAR